VTIRWARLKLWSISVSISRRVLRDTNSNAPCSVNVMDCSNFSSSSVKVSARGCAAELMRDIAINVVVSLG
jgi:hypothetical protein